jgi:hypothetical protein
MKLRLVLYLLYLLGLLNRLLTPDPCKEFLARLELNDGLNPDGNLASARSHEIDRLPLVVVRK